jgi:hypothetical protein
MAIRIGALHVVCAFAQFSVALPTAPRPAALRLRNQLDPIGLRAPKMNAAANREFRRARSWQRDYGACGLL